MSDLAAHAAGTVWQWRRREDAAEETHRRAVAGARRRGLIGLAVGLAAAALVLWFGHPTMAAVVAAIALALALVALASPARLYPRIAALLEGFGRLVGSAVTWLLMTLAWLLLFTPVGLLLRVAGKLRLQRAYDARRTSYWQPAKQLPQSLERYRRQF